MVFDNISSLLKSSFIDWSGKICSVIFLRGCNFRCPTCHNYELIYTNQTIEFDYVLRTIKDQIKWIDGVNISGGEPTIYKDLPLLVKEIKKIGLDVKVDTNGSNPDMVDDLFSEVSLFAVDIKGPFEKYYYLTGESISSTEIEQKITRIINLSKHYPNKFYFRTTLVPSLTDEDLEIVKSYVYPLNIHFQDYIPTL